MLCYLVVKRPGPEVGEVHLDLLSDPPPRPLLGRSVTDPSWYREFRSAAALLATGCEPVGPYRVCDTLDDYQKPWMPPAPDQPPAPMDR